MFRDLPEDREAGVRLIMDYPNILYKEVDLDPGFHLHLIKVAAKEDLRRNVFTTCKGWLKRNLVFTKPMEGWIVRLWYKREQGSVMSLCTEHSRYLAGATAEDVCEDCLAGIRSVEEYHLLTRERGWGRPGNSYLLASEVW